MLFTVQTTERMSLEETLWRRFLRSGERKDVA
jgi:hypothetical protein